MAIEDAKKKALEFIKNSKAGNYYQGFEKMKFNM